MSERSTLDPGGRAARSRGFTLIELLVVVVIITIVSAIAIPGVVNRMRSARTRQAADDIAITIRQARIRALGRNSAVLVRYTDATGSIEVREAIQGPVGPGGAAAAGCERRAESSCLLPTTRWNVGNPKSQRIKLTNYEASGDLTMVNAGGTDIDLCFAPSGRSYIRNTSAGATPFGAWTTPVRFDIDRVDGHGFQRTILITPAGTARVVASPGGP